jgi:tetratricopeptide (TPR) repeat protein
VEVFIRDNNVENVYFTAAVNEGLIKYLEADCRYMILLNQDMYLEPNAVEAMVRSMEAHPKAGIGSPLEHVVEQPDGDVLAGGLEAFPSGVHRSGPRSRFAFDEPILWANGSCMILRRQMIRQIGLLDESFKLICSDSDYCFTARSRGWEVWRIGAAYGVHEHGVSGAGSDPAIELMKIDDMLRFARKWLTGGLYRQLAYDAAKLTPQAVEETVTRYEHVRDHLLHEIHTATPRPAVPHIPVNDPNPVTSQMVDTLRTAARHHRLGDLDQAEQLYREVLRERPHQALALHSLGLIAYQRGRLEQAEVFVTEAICCDPESPHQYNTMGVIFESLSQPDKAINAYHEAVRLKPDYAEAHRNLATALGAQGQMDQAVASFQAALQAEPDRAETHLDLADTLKRQGRSAEAVLYYKKAIELQPDLAEAHNNLATTLKQLYAFDEAIRHQERAIELRPNAADFYGNLAGILQDQGRLDEAIRHCRKAVDLSPDRPQVHTNLASVLRDAGCLEEAIDYNAKALSLAPDLAEAHWNQAVCLLLAGRFTEGWREFSWRRQINYRASYPHVHPQPLWDGRDLHGKRLFVYCEQGLGDAIQFVRYLPMVSQRGGTVVFGAWGPLCRLFAGLEGMGERIVLSWQQIPAVDFDLHVSLLDLPGLMGTTLETIPNPVPYLFADTNKVQSWRQQLGGTGLKVGIAWAGNPTHSNDHKRSCPLRHLEALAHIKGIHLCSLQRDIRDLRDREALQRLGMADLSDRLQDLTDTAAVIENLDLVVSVDTAVLHLAGAMGKPVWGLIPYSPDWRWMLHREDSPWYPTLRLFRQSRPGDWEGVLGRVATALEQRMVEAKT